MQNTVDNMQTIFKAVFRYCIFYPQTPLLVHTYSSCCVSYTRCGAHFLEPSVENCFSNSWDVSIRSCFERSVYDARFAVKSSTKITSNPNLLKLVLVSAATILASCVVCRGVAAGAFLRTLKRNFSFLILSRVYFLRDERLAFLGITLIRRRKREFGRVLWRCILLRWGTWVFRRPS